MQDFRSILLFFILLNSDLSALPTVTTNDVGTITSNCFWRCNAGGLNTPDSSAGWCGICVYVSDNWAMYTATPYLGGYAYIGYRTSGSSITWTGIDNHIVFESTTVTVASVGTSANTDLNFTIAAKSGYTPKFISYGQNNKHGGIIPWKANSALSPNATVGSLSVFNLSGAVATNVTFTAYVMYEKNA